MIEHPFIFSNQLKYRLRRHVSFWVFWWLFLGFLYSFSPASGIYYSYWSRLFVSMVDSLCFIPCHMFVTYSLMYFVIPRYLVKGKYLATGISVLFSFLITATLSTAISAFIVTTMHECLAPTFLITAPLRTGVPFFYGLLAGLRGGITVGGLGAAIKLMKHWYIKNQRNLQLQKENVESQLQLLKAQVHPHFLFNTLNNIYSYTQNTSPVGSRLVMGLSDLLRYMLYECNQPLVPLQQDLKMLQEYISLEKVRYEDDIEIHVELPENMQGYSIAPLLLLPLVENCFKHGTSDMLEHPWLNLQVRLVNSCLQVKLMNGKTDVVEKKQHAGIGISNVRKRLELLYPDKHGLEITNDPDIHIVNLWIQLEKATPSRKKEIKTFALSSHE